MSEPIVLRSANQAVEPEGYGYNNEPPDQPAVPLSHYLWLLRRHRWKMLAFVAVCVTASIVISACLTHIYEATATVDIDQKIPAAVVGQDATSGSANDADQFLATQVNLIQSDSVLRPVALQYHLLNVDKHITDPAQATAAEDAP